MTSGTFYSKTSIDASFLSKATGAAIVGGGAEFRDRFADQVNGQLGTAITGQRWGSYSVQSGTAPAVKGFDTANEAPNAQWFIDAYTAGFRLYVGIGTYFAQDAPYPDTEALLGQALDAGMQVALYSRNPLWYRSAITAAGKYLKQLQFFAIDIETDPGVPVTRAMVDDIKSLGVRPIIYTGSGMWPGIMGSDSSFSDIPLWDTNASPTVNFATWQANMNSPAPVPYAGWNTASTMRVGIQQKFEQTLNGVNIDLNSFDGNFLSPPVSAGKLAFPTWTTGATALHSAALLAHRVMRQGAAFTFEPGATATAANDTGSVTIAGWDGDIAALSRAAGTAQTPPTAVHLNITRTGWRLSYVPTLNGTITSVASGTFAKPLANDGSVYMAEYVLDPSAGKVYLTLPNGTTATVADSHFTTVFNGRYAGFSSVRPDATHSRTAFTETWGDSGPRSELVAARRVAETSVALPGAAPIGPRPGGYDRRLNVYNLKPTHLRNTRMALGQAAVGTGYARIGFAGDSTTEGTGVTPAASRVTQAWPAQFCALLAGRGYPNNGPGIVPATTGTASGSQWTNSGFSPFNAGSSFTQAAALGSTTTFASTTAGTTAFVYYLNTGTSFTVSVDGAASGTGFASVTTNGTQTVGLATLTGLANTTHTLVITAPGAAVQIVSAGVAASSGVLGYNYALTASYSGDWAAPGNWYRNAFLLASARPNLTVLMLGVNDFKQNLFPATYNTYMQGIINDLRAVGSDIVLVTPTPYASNDLSPFVSVLYDLADKNDLPLIDLGDRWGAPVPNSPNYADTTYFNPSAAGNADIAHAVLNALAF